MLFRSVSQSRYLSNSSTNTVDNDTLLRVVELLENIAETNEGINKGVGKMAKGDIILDNGRGNSSVVNVIRPEGSQQVQIPNKPSAEFEYHRKIVRGGNFVSR